MLVLTRRVGEAVVIRPTGMADDPSRDIVVTFVMQDGNRVRLGFETPSGFVVLREEISGPGCGDLPHFHRRIESGRDR